MSLSRASARFIAGAVCCWARLQRAPKRRSRLREAISTALRDNPELRGFAYALKAHDGRSAQAALKPAPELGFTAENIGGTGEVRGFTGTEFTLTLSQLFELGDKRGRRVDIADAERSLIEADRVTRQLDLVSDVLRQFIAVAADQERRTLAQQAVQLAEATQATPWTSA